MNPELIWKRFSWHVTFGSNLQLSESRRGRTGTLSPRFQQLWNLLPVERFRSGKSHTPNQPCNSRGRWIGSMGCIASVLSVSLWHISFFVSHVSFEMFSTISSLMLHHLHFSFVIWQWAVVLRGSHSVSLCTSTSSLHRLHSSIAVAILAQDLCVVGPLLGDAHFLKTINFDLGIVACCLRGVWISLRQAWLFASGPLRRWWFLTMSV